MMNYCKFLPTTVNQKLRGCCDDKGGYRAAYPQPGRDGTESGLGRRTRVTGKSILFPKRCNPLHSHAPEKLKMAGFRRFISACNVHMLIKHS
jgi:hypothetical protein